MTHSYPTRRTSDLHSAETADPRRNDRHVERALRDGVVLGAGDLELPLHAAVERDRAGAGEAALNGGGRAAQDRNVGIERHADAQELRIGLPQRDLAHLTGGNARISDRRILGETNDRLKEADVVFLLVRAAPPRQPEAEESKHEKQDDNVS